MDPRLEEALMQLSPRAAQYLLDNPDLFWEWVENGVHDELSSLR